MRTRMSEDEARLALAAALDANPPVAAEVGAADAWAALDGEADDGEAVLWWSAGGATVLAVVARMASPTTGRHFARVDLSAWQEDVGAGPGRTLLIAAVWIPAARPAPRGRAA